MASPANLIKSKTQIKHNNSFNSLIEDPFDLPKINNKKTNKLATSIASVSTIGNFSQRHNNSNSIQVIDLEASPKDEIRHNHIITTSGALDSKEDSNSDSDSESSSFQQGSIRKKRKTLEEMTTLGDKTKAEAYRNKHMLRKIVDGKYEKYSIIHTSTAELGEYGAGLELYFNFVKQLGYLFSIISLISVWPIYENNSGNGLHHGAAKQWWSYWTVANQKSITLDSLVLAEDDLSPINQSRIMLSIADFICGLCFIIFLIRYSIHSRRIVAENFKNNVTAADYAVEVKGVPEDFSDTGLLKEHFEQYGEVCEVYLARKYDGLLNEYKKRAELSIKLGYERAVALKKGFKNEDKIKKLEAKIQKFDTTIHLKFKKGHINHNQLPVNRGFLIYNRLDDKKTCLKECKAIKRCCRSSIIPIEQYFLGKHILKVKQTTEPSNILWENLEISRWNRMLRKSVSIFLALIVLLASIVVIYVMKAYDSSLPSDVYCVEVLKINLNLSFSAAEKIYTSNNESFCYCKFQSWSDIMSDTDINSYCSYFIFKITTNLMIKFCSSCGVIFINFLLRTIFKRLSKFERVSNKTKEQLNIMIKVFIAQFINTALIILIVNANFDKVSAVYYIPYTKEIFSGEFSDFTREWYVNIGESLVFTMIVCIVSPHLLTLMIICPFNYCKRRCFYKLYKTQKSLNRSYTGPEFDLACRNSQVLNLIFTCYLYSSTIPFLNLIAALALFVLYWTDKILILRHYRKPPLLSYHLNNAAIKFIPIIIIMHSCFAIHMYGSESIFPTGVEVNSNGEVQVKDNSIIDRLFSIPGILNGSIIISAGFTALMLFCYSDVLSKCKKHKNKVETETQECQGTYREELETIKKHGLHTYKILENPEYHDLVISLDNGAIKVLSLRTSNETRPPLTRSRTFS